MKCKSAERLLPEYIEGTLSLGRVRQLELHIDNCLRCQKGLETFEKTIRLASNLPIEYPSPEVWEAFWPNLRMRISQRQAFEKDRLPLWVRTHGWKMAGVACVLTLLLSLWGLSNSRQLKAPIDTPTFGVLISRSFIAEIPVEQLQEQLNHELQSLDVPSVWDGEGSLVDEIDLPNSVESTDLVNQLFRVINSEINIESFGDEVLTDFVPSTKDQFVFTVLD
jgi:anti-sigma factor RsiW